MTGTNQNFNSKQWAAHVSRQQKAERRVTPILEKQAQNDPNRSK